MYKLLRYTVADEIIHTPEKNSLFFYNLQTKVCMMLKFLHVNKYINKSIILKNQIDMLNLTNLPKDLQKRQEDKIINTVVIIGFKYVN